MPTAPPKQLIPLDYRDLAQWAETADGLRGKDLVIAEIEENGKFRRVLRRKDQVKPEQIVLDEIRAQQNPLAAAKRAVTKVMIEVEGKPGKLIECKSKDGIMCDSVFCTESAIEKFLFLYYRAQRLLTEDEWDKLDAALNDSNVLAIGHIWPSSRVEVQEPAQTEDRFLLLDKKELAFDGTPVWVSLSEYTPPTVRGSVP